MNNQTSQEVSITVDLKKFRFRVHRRTLRALGDPSAVQLMFDPDKKAIMLFAAQNSTAFGQEEKVVFDKPGNDGTFQLYSMGLIRKIQAIVSGLEDETTYYLSGRLIASLNAAYFPLDPFPGIKHCEVSPDGNENRH